MVTQQSNSTEMKRDFRASADSKEIPKAVGDGGGGTIIAVANIDATPQ
jgi:hypothetical protein